MRRGWSISRKLLLLVLASVLVGLLAAATLSMRIESDRYLALKLRELETAAHVFASAVASAVAMGDASAARNSMRAIGQIDGIIHARVELLDGRVLAEMGILVQLDSDPKFDGNGRLSLWRTVSSRSVQVTVPVRDSGATVGQFVLVGDASGLTENLLKTLRLTLFSALFSVTLALLVAARLQGRITGPLRNLISAVERVRRTHDYGAQIEATGNDEVGQLVDSFNETLCEIRKRDNELEKLAYYDPLTGLANRALFRRKLEESLARCKRTEVEAALLLLDLDRFKEVNDTLGHAAGDELLAKVAQLIGNAISKDHFLARLGGDEFAIIVPEYGSLRKVECLAAQVIEAVSGSIALERGDVAVETSIGIVRFPLEAATANDVLRNADLALYQAKAAGRGRFEFFKPAMHAAVQFKTELGRELRSALCENNGLSLHYQPQIDLATGRVAGFEGLLRWRHPTRGSIPPSEFIPIAENSRLIGDLGVWVLRQAASQAKEWLDIGEPPREVAVNMSAAQLRLVDVVKQVAGVLDETRLPPRLLCIELTESLLADNAEGRVRTMLMGLKGLGVTLALDDFGTGYSSLGYLARLPFDKLKIDRVFVDGVDNSPRACELLKGVVGLGRGLGMTVVAEGAEKQGEVKILRQFGCDQAQGYIFARPAVAAEAISFARARETEGSVFEGLTGETGRSQLSRHSGAAAA